MALSLLLVRSALALCLLLVRSSHLGIGDIEAALVAYVAGSFQELHFLSLHSDTCDWLQLLLLHKLLLDQTGRRSRPTRAVNYFAAIAEVTRLKLLNIIIILARWLQPL